MSKHEIIQCYGTGLHINRYFRCRCREGICGCVVTNVLDVNVFITFVVVCADTGYTAAKVLLFITEACFVEGDILFRIARDEDAVVCHLDILRLAAPLFCPML